MIWRGVYPWSTRATITGAAPPSVTLSQAFTQWAPNGEWAAQVMQFVTPKALAYVALAVTGKNHTDVSYVAFDLE
jgi:hypothetical protein